MARVFLSLGSNVGDRLRFLQRAVDELHSRSEIVLGKVSSIYVTQPVGVKDQREFLNLALEAEVFLPPEKLLHTIQDVEKRVGRTQSERWGPREIDIDILLYNDQTIEVGDLQIPHPELAKRRFVLVPLQELDGKLVHPIQNITVENLLKLCTNDSFVRKSTTMTIELKHH